VKRKETTGRVTERLRRRVAHGDRVGRRWPTAHEAPVVAAAYDLAQRRPPPRRGTARTGGAAPADLSAIWVPKNPGPSALAPKWSAPPPPHTTFRPDNPATQEYEKQNPPTAHAHGHIQPDPAEPCAEPARRSGRTRVAQHDLGESTRVRPSAVRLWAARRAALGGGHRCRRSQLSIASEAYC
jgi:hypothetical protein